MTKTRDGAAGGQFGDAVQDTNSSKIAPAAVSGELALNLRPVAHASLYAPAGQRRLWHIAYVCPHCKAGHFGRGRTAEAVVGHRRSGCGRLVWIAAARVYPGSAAA